MSSSQMMKNICRTCLSSDGELISLFSATSSMGSLPTKIMNISHVLIEKDDLAYMICKKCIFLVESFNCFKKQIESANKYIKNACWRRKEKFAKIAKVPKAMANFCGRIKECDDLDYEIEYISEEVKRDVESAFKRKRARNICKKRLAEVCVTLQDLQNVVLHHIEGIKEKSQTVIANHGTKILTIETDKPYGGKEEKTVKTKETRAKNNAKVPKDIEHKITEPQKFIRGVKKQRITEKSHEIEEGTFNIINSCFFNENVAMETKEFENIEPKTCEPDCDNCAQNLKPDKSANMEENIVQPDEPDCGNEKQILGPDKPQNIEENILVPGKLNCGDKEKSMEIENRDEIEEKYTESDFSIKNQSVQTDKIVERIFKPVETNRSNEDTDMMIGSSNETLENACQPQEIDCNNQYENMNTEKSSNKSSNNSNGLKIENHNYDSEIQFVDVERLDDIEQEALKPEIFSTIKNEFSKKSNEKIMEGENPYDDVIVISSDNSDEEHYMAFVKNGMPSDNCRSSWLAQSSRIKLLQSQLIARRNRMGEKKLMNGKNIVQTIMKKNRQPGKYYQCTTCNINLYSVSAVLYHHNENHTLSHESLSCQMCDKIFPTKNILFQHFDQHLEAHLYRCSECNCEFVLKKNLRAHVNCHARGKLEEPENKAPNVDDANSKREMEIRNDEAAKEEKALVESRKDGCQNIEREKTICGKSDINQMEISSDKNVGH